jgi:hypothetical protein
MAQRARAKHAARPEPGAEGSPSRTGASSPLETTPWSVQVSRASQPASRVTERLRLLSTAPAKADVTPLECGCLVPLYDTRVRRGLSLRRDERLRPRGARPVKRHAEFQSGK